MLCPVQQDSGLRILQEVVKMFVVMVKFYKTKRKPWILVIYMHVSKVRSDDRRPAFKH